MATFNIESSEAESEVSTRVPVVSNLVATLKVKEYSYVETAANKSWCILLKVEIMSPDRIKVATKTEVKEYSIAGQDFITRIMLEGKDENKGIMPRGSVKALKELGIDPSTLDVEDSSTLQPFHGLEFVAKISSKAQYEQELNPETGLQRNRKDSNGNDIVRGGKWEFAPWDIQGLV